MCRCDQAAQISAKVTVSVSTSRAHNSLSGVILVVSLFLCSLRPSFHAAAHWPGGPHGRRNYLRLAASIPTERRVWRLQRHQELSKTVARALRRNENVDMKPGSGGDRLAATLIAAFFMSAGGIIAIFLSLSGEWRHTSMLIVAIFYVACALGLSFIVVNSAFITPSRGKKRAGYAPQGAGQQPVITEQPEHVRGTVPSRWAARPAHLKRSRGAMWRIGSAFPPRRMMGT